MTTLFRALLCLAAGACHLTAASLSGTITDPSGSPIPGAAVALYNRTGIAFQTVTGDSGRFQIGDDRQAGRLVVSASGFATRTITLPAADPLQITLDLASYSDSIRVGASAIDAPAAEQGSSVTVIPRREIENRDQAQALDLLREVPGLWLAQSGPRGSAASVFIRGGDSKYNLVEINGVTVNSFYYGGLFDFAHVPTDFLDQIEVIRGPQSAIYGSYANAGVVNFRTRTPEASPSLELLAEGGTYREHRFAATGSFLLKGFGVIASASRLDDHGPVSNSDYGNENAYLGITRAWRNQALSLFGNFNRNDTGAPGPYGSNPAGLFSGIDTVSRNGNDFSDYSAHYQAGFGRVREELFGGLFLNRSGYASPYGDSYNRDLRGQAESRTVVSVTRNYTLAAGAAWSRESMTNTYVLNSAFATFPLVRNQVGIYEENRFVFANRLFVNAGVRTEVFDTARIPGYQDLYSTRPLILARTQTSVNPKLAAAYALPGGTRFHASFGTGIRPPGGFDLAFTDNPALKPERTRSFDAGVSQTLWANRLSLDAAYFHNGYRDLIVSLGGNLARLSSFQTDNLNRARAQGVETSAQLRPVRHVSLSGSWTWLDTRLEALRGSRLAQAYFTVGQPLLRRPKQSGTLLANFEYGRVSTTVFGAFRGRDLDVEPNYGASAGLFYNPGFPNVGASCNIRAGRGATLFVSVRNLLNRRFEEIYGYPSPLLNFSAGVKWRIHGRS